MEVKIVEVSKVSPYSTSPSNFSLPLTSFDWPYMNFSPIKCLLFYALTASNPPFLDSILPKLKHSLSLTLQHFLPLAGHLIWPHDSPKPFFLCTPNDRVSFTVAETDSDFSHISGNNAHEIKESESLVPTIQSSDTEVPVMAIQVTKFSTDGFSIGIARHHVLFDGNSATMFLKAWAYICKNLDQPCSLLPELTPSFDRDSAVLQTPSDFVPSNKNLMFSTSISAPSDWFHGTFQLTRAHIEKLKKKVLDSLMEKSSLKELHLSTFVVAYAYAIACLIKANQEEIEEKLLIVLTADARGLLDPPIPSNYFGNCLSHTVVVAEGREIFTEGGFTNIAKKVSDLITKLMKSGNSMKEPKQPEVQGVKPLGMKIFSVGSSPKFKLYETDFGWGKPKKIEMLSLGKNNISITDTRNGGGAVEVGVVLPSFQQMDVFAALFSNGLN